MSTIAASRRSSYAAVTAKRPTVSEGAVGLRAAAAQAKKHVTLGNISNVHAVGERVAGNRKVAAMPGNMIRITRAISRGIIAGDLGFRFLPFVFLDHRHSVFSGVPNGSNRGGFLDGSCLFLLYCDWIKCIFGFLVRGIPIMEMCCRSFC
jgi:hypothetical protein